jgi:hypothetical protein
MKIRIIFQCSRCGSITFRSSTPNAAADATAADHMLDATDARKWVRQNSNV